MLTMSNLLVEIEKVLKVFQFFGFVDSTKTINANLKIKFVAILSFLIFGAERLLSVEIRKHYPESNIYIHLVLYGCASFSAIFSMILPLIQRNQIALLLGKIECIDKKFSNLLFLRVNHKLIVKFCLIHLIFCSVIFTSFSVLITFGIVINRPQLSVLLIYAHSSVIISGISLLRFNFFVQLVAIYSKILDKSLEESAFTNNPKLTIYQLKILCTIQRLLWESKQIISKIFNEYIIIAYGSALSGIIYRGFLLCDEILRHRTFFVHGFFGITQELFILCYVIFTIEDCIKIVSAYLFLTYEYSNERNLKIRRIPSNLHLLSVKFGKSSMNAEILSAIEIMSVQIIHQRMEFSLGQIFSLKYTTIVSVSILISLNLQYHDILLLFLLNPRVM